LYHPINQQLDLPALNIKPVFKMPKTSRRANRRNRHKQDTPNKKVDVKATFQFLYKGSCDACLRPTQIYIDIFKNAEEIIQDAMAQDCINLKEQVYEDLDLLEKELLSLAGPTKKFHGSMWSGKKHFEWAVGIMILILLGEKETDKFGVTFHFLVKKSLYIYNHSIPPHLIKPLIAHMIKLHPEKINIMYDKCIEKEM